MTFPELLTELNYDDILEANKAYIKEIAPDIELVEGDSAMLTLRAFSYREMLLRALFNKLARGFFLETAEGSDLDNLAETLYGLYRLKGAKPYANFEFRLTKELEYDFLIPAGFLLTDGNNSFAKTVEDIIIKAGEIKSNGIAELQQEIKDSKVETSLQVEPLPFLEVIQLDFFENGANPESDEEFKERIRVSFANKSTAGSELTYRSFALQADERIEDIKIFSNTPGVVEIVYYSSEADSLMQSRIEEALNKEEIRPLTDLVEIKAAQIENIDISATLTISTKVDAATTYNKALESIKSLKFAIGKDVSIAALIAKLMIDGVIDVDMHTPTTNIKIDFFSIAIISNINIDYRIDDEL